MTEFWLSGEIDDVPPLLMPAAATFLQVRHDVPVLLTTLTVDQVWRTVGRSASIGFHAMHIAGATSRLMTYARGAQLTAAQLADVASETVTTGLTSEELIVRVERAIDAALIQVRAVGADELLAPRGVGRKLLPSTTLGVISHAAEHAYRHAGQIATLRHVLFDR